MQLNPDVVSGILVYNLRTINMEEKKKIVVVARTEGIEIIVEGEKDTDDYELLLSKPQAMELAMSILNTLYKTGIKI